ncbi:helix-turn-helix domain-containing protein [Bailinhaonella thermotolerans]|uniref:XRE family transcriptional regulator n=1 Tax=Bailinhaonella thermotolerans TaxID=1070861 RepID=A0A3A4B3Y1_9ACTN|nr:helix-turn-helix transcriptional regulator [Bailinhaonella thermotolerans]RJL35871.1 XRE family transcriptional regulator [Bailinhaonella thermotolerans]
MGSPDSAPPASSRGSLGEFLFARRAAVSAAEHGLPEPPYRRRVPGLRREEVAQLAGISTDYYTRLEQGRVRTASRSVLAAIGRALRLNEDQQRHLFKLANPGRAGRRGEGARQVGAQTARLLANLIDTPALVFGRYLDILAWNRLGSALLGDLSAMPARRRNYVRMLFLDPRVRALPDDWPARAREAVSSLRMAAGACPERPRLRELVGELSARDADFRTWWSQHLVNLHPFGHTRLHHPAAGTFDVDWQALTSIDEQEQAIVLITAPAGGPDHAAIRRLSEWADRQNLSPSHPAAVAEDERVAAPADQRRRDHQ